MQDITFDAKAIVFGCGIVDIGTFVVALTRGVLVEDFFRSLYCKGIILNFFN